MSALDATFQKKPIGKVKVSPKVWDRADDPGGVYAMRCDGDCLAPLVEDGNHLIVDPSRNIEPGDLAVFWPKHGDKAALKIIISADDTAYKVYMLRPFSVLALPINRIETVHRVIGIYRER